MNINPGCPVCGENKYKICMHNLRNTEDYTDDKTFKIVKCSKCGLKRLYPVLDKNRIIEYYSSQYYGKGHKRFKNWIEPFLKIPHFKKAKELLHLKTGKQKILDIGCGRGWLLFACRELNMEVVGTEISELSSKFAREELKLEVIPEDVTNCNFPDKGFDIINAAHSFEHLPNPKEVMLEVKRILKKDGCLVLTIPNMESFNAKITGKNWFPLDIPHHYYHYSLKTINNLLAVNGLKIKKINYGSTEYDLFSILQSFLNGVCSKHSFLYNLLRNNYRINIRKTEYFYNLSVTLLFLPLMGILAKLIFIFEKIGKRSGTMEIRAGF